MSATLDLLMVRFKKTSATYLEATAMLLSKLIRSSKAIDDIILINRLVAFRSGYNRSFQIKPNGQENTTVALLGKHNANTVTAPTIKK